MSVVYFGDSGLDLIELQILTNWRLGKKFTFSLQISAKRFQGVYFLSISEKFERYYSN